MHIEQLMAELPVAILCVDAKGEIECTNQAADELFGYLPGELIGQKVEVLVPPSLRAAHVHHRDDFVSAPRARRMGAQRELAAMRKDGSCFDAEIHLHMVKTSEFTGTIAAISNVSERKQIDAALARSNLALMLINRVSQAVIEARDEVGLLQAVCDVMVTSGGYLCATLSRVFPNSATPLLPVLGRSSEWSPEQCYRFMSSLVPLTESWLPRLLQSAVPYRFYQLQNAALDSDSAAALRAGRIDACSAILLAVEGQPFGVLCLYSQRADTVSADHHEALSRLARVVQHGLEGLRRNYKLMVARDEAEKASRAKTEFLSRMSHELRTPLNAILGFGQLLQMNPAEPLAAMQTRGMEQIMSGGRHLMRLIDEVLDLARIESGRLDVHMRHLDLSRLVAECLDMVVAQLEARGVVLDAEVPDQLMVYGDEVRVRQVLLNLITNAIKYNRPSGRISVRAQASSETVLVEVVDTGVGIAPARQAGLFQPFNRLGAEDGEVEGTGIGLVITKRLIEAMGGTIGFHSNEGEGSTFWLRFLRGTLDGAAGDDAAAKPTAPSASRQRILYVEDNPANQLLMQSVIAALSDLELISAEDAISGIELAQETLPALILMDINLPVMSGLEAARLLKGNADTARIPLFAVSAAATPSDIQRGLEAGFDDYITKPFDMQVLLGKIQEALGRTALPVVRTSARALPPLPGMDMAAALARCRDDADVLCAVLRKFVEQHGDFVVAFRSFYLADREQARRSVHSLKGLAANLGMQVLAEQCALLEDALAHKMPDADVNRALAGVETLHALQYQRIVAWLQEIGEA